MTEIISHATLRLSNDLLLIILRFYSRFCSSEISIVKHIILNTQYTITNYTNPVPSGVSSKSELYYGILFNLFNSKFETTT